VAGHQFLSVNAAPGLFLSAAASTATRAIFAVRRPGDLIASPLNSQLEFINRHQILVEQN
jgi:hypothetical protein